MKKFLMALPFVLLVLLFLIGPGLLGLEATLILSTPIGCIVFIELCAISTKSTVKHNLRKIIKDKDLLYELKQALDELDYYR